MWVLTRADPQPSAGEIADALNADAGTFSTSCRDAGDDLYRCQTTARDGRVADYRVALGADGCWLAHPRAAARARRRPQRCAPAAWTADSRTSMSVKAAAAARGACRFGAYPAPISAAASALSEFAELHRRATLEPRSRTCGPS